jgi:hypothetical protein
VVAECGGNCGDFQEVRGIEKPVDRRKWEELRNQLIKGNECQPYLTVGREVLCQDMTYISTISFNFFFLFSEIVSS